MHRLKPGPANQSYGLQVAKLAGIPAATIQLARKKLQLLEQQAIQDGAQIDLFACVEQPAPVEHPLVAAVTSLNPDELSPRQALEAIYHLIDLAGEGKE